MVCLDYCKTFCSSADIYLFIFLSLSFAFVKATQKALYNYASMFLKAKNYTNSACHENRWLVYNVTCWIPHLCKVSTSSIIWSLNSHWTWSWECIHLLRIKDWNVIHYITHDGTMIAVWQCMMFLHANSHLSMEIHTLYSSRCSHTTFTSIGGMW